MFSYEFCKNFINTFFAERLRVTASWTKTFLSNILKLRWPPRSLREKLIMKLRQAQLICLFSLLTPFFS